MVQKSEKDGSKSANETPSFRAPVASASVGADVSVHQTDARSMEASERVHCAADGENDAVSDAMCIDACVVMRTFDLNKDQRAFVVLGCIGTALAGAAWPLIGLAFSEVCATLQTKDNESGINFWSLVFVGIGIMSLIGNTLQYGMLGVSGERLTRKVRACAFRAVLRQEIGFFDCEKNSVGALTTRLATDSSRLKGICSDQLGAVAIIASTIVVGFIISYTGALLAIVVLCLMPLMAFSAWVQLWTMIGMGIVP